MLLKVNGQYLDFSGSLTIERHVKIFEEIDSTYGDFSYSASMTENGYNMGILGIPYADVANKIIYNEVACDAQDNEGDTIYSGKLMIEKIKGGKIFFSFFSGNYNWLSLLTGSVNELNFSEYDTALNVSDISDTWLLEEGMVFPLIDAGALITRSHRTLVPQDFNGCMYVKTIFNKIFYSLGIKIEGELINDFIYQNAIICKNNKDKEEINANACYVQKSSTTTRVIENTDYKMTFQNDSVYPYYDGENDGFDLANSRYVAPYQMRVEVEVHLEPDIIDATYNNRINLWINGAFTFVDIGLAVGGLYNSATPGDQDDIVYKGTFNLDQGDTLEVYSNWQQSGGSTQNDIVSGSIKITPLFIYNVKGSSAVPNWTKQDFVINYLNLFNVVSDYNPFTKTITFNFFDKIKSKTPVDISKYIKVDEVDFTEFISNYGRKNIFKYEESDDEEIRDYNITKFLKYGEGSIDVDNDFIEDTKTVIESKFKAPISYLNGPFGCSLERVNFITMQESDGVGFTSVSDSSGVARFNTVNNSFLVGDFVRIKESNMADYVGDWRVTARTNLYFELQGVSFKESATGEASKITHTYGSSDEVYLFINIPDYSISDLSERTIYSFPPASITSIAYAFFNILQNGQTINTQYEQGLSFGAITSQFSYQKTLLQTYWRNFSGILADPVKLKCTGHLPKSVYKSLSPLNPVYIKTETTTGLYYTNRITGYEENWKPCDIELIKL